MQQRLTIHEADPSTIATLFILLDLSLDALIFVRTIPHLQNHISPQKFGDLGIGPKGEKHKENVPSDIMKGES